MQVIIPVGCVPYTAVAAGSVCIPACTGQGGGVYPNMHWAGGVYPSMHWTGVSAWGVSAQGVSAWGCLQGGVSAPVHAGIHTPPPVNRIIDAYENITLPQLRCRR